MKKFIKEHKRIFIIVIISLSSLVLVTTLGRYVYNVIHDYILESQGFYFSSSVLGVNTNEYKINNWDGVNSYTVTVDVNNEKNELIYTKGDINYDISVECSNNVNCSVDKNKGIIYKDAKKDSYAITMTPKNQIKDDEVVVITTHATSISPYKKDLSAKYTIGIEKRGFSYSIKDNVGDKYFTLEITNSITYYQVKEAFDNYSVGDKISYETYKLLTDENKKKCFSALVKLTFDPTNMLLDMTNDNYLNRIDNSESVENIEGFDYVKGFSFNVLASSSQKIIFYKNDLSMNYTYPIINEESIIDVDVTTAD